MEERNGREELGGERRKVKEDPAKAVRRCVPIESCFMCGCAEKLDTGCC